MIVRDGVQDTVVPIKTGRTVKVTGVPRVNYQKDEEVKSSALEYLNPMNPAYQIDYDWESFGQHEATGPVQLLADFTVDTSTRIKPNEWKFELDTTGLLQTGALVYYTRLLSPDQYTRRVLMHVVGSLLEKVPRYRLRVKTHFGHEGTPQSGDDTLSFTCGFSITGGWVENSWKAILPPPYQQAVAAQVPPSDSREDEESLGWAFIDNPN